MSRQLVEHSFQVGRCLSQAKDQLRSELPNVRITLDAVSHRPDKLKEHVFIASIFENSDREKFDKLPVDLISDHKMVDGLAQLCGLLPRIAGRSVPHTNLPSVVARTTTVAGRGEVASLSPDGLTTNVEAA